MKDFWNRFSARTKERILVAAGYFIWIVVFWFLGKPHMMTPASAFFGLAALTAVFAALCGFVKSMIVNGHPNVYQLWESKSVPPCPLKFTHIEAPAGSSPPCWGYGDLPKL